MMNKLLRSIKNFFIPLKENNYRPIFLEGKVLFPFLLVIIFLKLAIVPFLFYVQKTPFFGAILKSELIQELNKERISQGLNPLKENSLLDRAAFLKARDIISKDYFSHWSPEGISPWHWFRVVGYNYKVAGENLAIGFLDSEEVNKAWLNSPSHRANILSPTYKDVGISVLKGNFQGNQTTIVVQLFGLPKSNKQAIFQLSKATTTYNNVNNKKVDSKKILIRKNHNLLLSNNNESDINEVKSASIQGETNEKKKVGGGNKRFPNNKGQNEVGPKIGGVVFNTFSFLTSRYYRITQKIIYGSLVFVIIILMVNIFVRFNVQHPDLIFKALVFFAILALFSLADKTMIINFLPHSMYIH